MAKHGRHMSQITEDVFANIVNADLILPSTDVCIALSTWCFPSVCAIHTSVYGKIKSVIYHPTEINQPKYIINAAISGQYRHAQQGMESECQL